MIDLNPIPIGIHWLKKAWAGVVWIFGFFRMRLRIDALERQLGDLKKQPASHRKCPACGERDLRLEDMYRHRPEIFEDRRFLHQKWRCYSCGHKETEDTEEPT